MSFNSHSWKKYTALSWQLFFSQHIEDRIPLFSRFHGWQWEISCKANYRSFEDNIFFYRWFQHLLFYFDVPQFYYCVSIYESLFNYLAWDSLNFLALRFGVYNNSARLLAIISSCISCSPFYYLLPELWQDIH